VPLTLGATFGSGDNEVAYLHPTEGKLAIAALSDGAGQSAGGGR